LTSEKLLLVLYSENSSNAFRPAPAGRGNPPANPPVGGRKGGGLPRSSATGGWYRGAAPMTTSSFSLAANSLALLQKEKASNGSFRKRLDCE